MHQTERVIEWKARVFHCGQLAEQISPYIKLHRRKPSCTAPYSVFEQITIRSARRPRVQCERPLCLPPMTASAKRERRQGSSAAEPLCPLHTDCTGAERDPRHAYHRR